MTFGTNPDDLNTGSYDTFDANAIQNGWDVFDANGDKVGDVHAVNGSYLTVSKGFLFPSERYIPVGDIQGTRHDRVYLSVTKDQLEQEGWDQPPTTTSGATGRMRSTGETYDTGTTAGTYDERTGRRTEMTAGREAATSGRDRTMELREQELVPKEQRVKAGEVHLHKDVVSEEQTVDVPVTHEEVTIDRHPVEGRGTTGGRIGQDEDITVPVYEEQVRLDKETRPYEEVDVNTRKVKETKRVSGQVKKEVLRSDTAGNVDVSGRSRQADDRYESDEHPPTE